MWTDRGTVKYYVVGGVHTDTTFTKVEKGLEECYGPYPSYQAALVEWHRRTFTHLLDNCNHRLEIVRETPEIRGAEILRRKTRPDND